MIHQQLPSDVLSRRTSHRASGDWKIPLQHGGIMPHQCSCLGKQAVKAASVMLSPNHWWKFSWLKVPGEGMEVAPFPKVGCISSAKPTLDKPAS
jgi:hypothetical protein